MPATFERKLERELDNVHNKFNFLDDILIIMEVSLQQHESEVDLVLKRLDSKLLSREIEKCGFARPTITWLGYKSTQTGICPTVKKTDLLLVI